MNNLPTGWIETTLGEVVDYGKTEKVEPNKIPANAWILELEDIEKDTSRLLKRLTLAQRESKSTKNAFKKDDVLYGKLRPYLNKVIIADQDGFCTTEIIPIKPNSVIYGQFLFYWLKTPEFLNYVNSVSYGLNMPRLGTKDGVVAPLVLAPLHEQKRIGEKLDSLLARVVSCESHLKRVPQILEHFRQSVLTKAISGELTEDWRGSETIENWSFERAEDVCEKVQSGGTPREGFIGKPGVPFLKVYNIVEQKIDFHYRPQYITKQIHTGSMSKSQAKPGDILMNIVGPPLGKVAIVPDDFPQWNINQAITLFRPNERILSKWIYYFLCSGRSVAEIIHETRGSAGQINISLSQCRNFVFPIPPVKEQTEIVQRVEKLFAYAESIETYCTSASEHVERLTPSLLAKAFRGELAEQDPRDEPAEKLLQRIIEIRKMETERRKNEPQKKKEKKMRTKAQRKSLYETLLETGRRLTPEDLFTQAGFDEKSIDEFYEELRAEIKKKRVEEIRQGIEKVYLKVVSK